MLAFFIAEIIPMVVILAFLFTKNTGFSECPIVSLLAIATSLWSVTSVSPSGLHACQLVYMPHLLRGFWISAIVFECLLAGLVIRVALSYYAEYCENGKPIIP